MNDYIVWDKLSTRFGFGKVLQVKLNGNLYVEFKDENGKEFYKYRTPKDIEHLNYIGLNDISNNKIYADCSIVEFDYDVAYNVNFRKLKGFFYYSSESVSYKLKLLVPLEFRGKTHYILQFSKKMSIKVVDTLQENKLNLIKE